ncbi:MAG: BadF/BadG/BcrA/BcrD ATPase family protein [Nakamurella sp.]
MNALASNCKVVCQVVSGYDLAFDIGQSGLRGIITSTRHEPAIFRIDTYRPSGSLADIVQGAVRALAQASGISSFDAVTSGLTSVYGSVGPIDNVFGLLNDEFGVNRLILSDDAFTSFLGARGLTSGVVAAVGTGLVVLGIDATGTARRVDGMGPMAGDDGSGWWIGRRGFIAAVSAADGRECGSAALLRSVISDYGSIDGILEHIHSSESAIASVAEFAMNVVNAARSGDDVSISIMRRAAQYIGSAIIAGAGTEPPGKRIQFSIVGGVSAGADLLVPDIVEFACRRGLLAVHEKPLGSALDGARLLGSVVGLERFEPLVRQASSRVG